LSDSFDHIRKDGIDWISEFLDLSLAVHDLVKAKGKQPKICILDTGCDPDCNFFKKERTGDPSDLDRIIWRDFTTPASTDMIDQDGVEAGNFGIKGKHGTNIATLLLMLLPRANIYVARIATDRRDMVNRQTYDGVLDSIRQVSQANPLPRCHADRASMRPYTTLQLCGWLT
jgi:hypothetical protein